METFGDRFFYGTDTIGPDGTAWAGFHCAKTSACPGRRIGVVGRLTNRHPGIRPRSPLRRVPGLKSRSGDRLRWKPRWRTGA
jgi:hypothetical protein